MVKMSTFFFGLCMLIIMVSFFLGSYAVDALGLFGGPESEFFLSKFHIYSYLGMLLFALYFYFNGISAIRRNLGKLWLPWLIFVCSLTYLILFGVLGVGLAGLAFVVDTLLVPALLFAVILGLNDEQKKSLLTLFAILILFNSLTAVLEYVTRTNVWPSPDPSFNYFRSHAWLAHPLNNALITCAVIPILLKHKLVSPSIYFFVGLLALFAFGARTATAIYILFMGFVLIYSLADNYKSKGGFSIAGLITFLIYLVLGLVVSFYLVTELNIGSRIFDNLTVDESGLARINVFYIFDFLSYSEVLFGASRDIFESMTDYIGNGVVENYVIGWILMYGVVGSLPLIMSFFYFCFSLFRVGDFYGKSSILIFVLVSLSNNSLAVKNPAFLFLLVLFSLHYGLAASKRMSSEEAVSDGPLDDALIEGATVYGRDGKEGRGGRIGRDDDLINASEGHAL